MKRGMQKYLFGVFHDFLQSPSKPTFPPCHDEVGAVTAEAGQVMLTVAISPHLTGLRPS